MAVKRSAKRNAPAKSETDAWLAVVAEADDLRKIVKTWGAKVDPRAAADITLAAKGLMANATAMLAQLRDGLHRNSPLTVLSLVNPPRGGKLMSDRLYTIEYKHKGNGKNYFHDFKPGTTMHAMPDGSIRISRPGAKVWGDYPAE